MKQACLFVTFSFLAFNLWTQSLIFVSPSGNDNTGTGSISNPYKTIHKAAGQVTQGDTVYVRAGTYHNSDFNDGDIWTGNFVARITAKGSPGNEIIFMPYNQESVRIEFDGIYGFLIQNAAYIKIIGFEFKGMADQISQTEAEDAWGLYKDKFGVIHDLAVEMGIDITDPNLVGQTIQKPQTNNIDKPIHYNGRALVANKCHHIEFLHNTIHHVPSAAIRAQWSDYITIAHNVVYDNTWWTTQGVGAITISEASVKPAGDSFTGTKIIIEKNDVYNNENRMYSWNPNKSFVHFEIDEGTGIFLTRNNDTYARGYMRISNNLSYRNGASGIVCHFTDRCIIEHNTVYDNGTTNHGKPGGIGINTADDVKVINNISYAKPIKWALGILAQPVTNLQVEGNIIYNENGPVEPYRKILTGWVEIDPAFVDGPNTDLHLSPTSPGINTGSTAAQETQDFDCNPRDQMPDVGAYEQNAQLPVAWIGFQLSALGPRQVKITWRVNEVNNDRFVVERSEDTSHWIIINELKSIRDHSSLHDYHTIDPNPIDGVNYYRIKQIDRDGSYSYSGIKNIVWPSSMASIRVFPNPTTDRLMLSGLPANVTVHFLDIEGHQQDIVMTPSGFGNYHLDVSNLPRGTYLLVIGTEVFKVVII